MPVDVKSKGRYELFETTEEHRILVLDDERWFAWIDTSQGHILVHSDSDHEKARTLHGGEYYFVDFHDDPTFKDMPHLFLQREGQFREYMLPNGFPTESDHQKKIVETDETIGGAELKRYLKHPEPAGEGESRMERKHPGGEIGRPERELPIPGFDELSVREAKRRLDDLDDRELRELRDHERENKDRKTMLEEIDRRLG